MCCLVMLHQIGLPGQRPIIASGIRGLIYHGYKTGPAMNPMIAFAWVSIDALFVHAVAFERVSTSLGRPVI
jgi:hypothetical protein